MSDISPEKQAYGRARLLAWARNDCSLSRSMLDWMEHPEVIAYCKDYNLDTKILEHIGYWTWYAMKH